MEVYTKGVTNLMGMVEESDGGTTRGFGSFPEGKRPSERPKGTGRPDVLPTEEERRGSRRIGDERENRCSTIQYRRRVSREKGQPRYSHL